jgi:glycosyltransferase involved in cell wall biosynthesis
MRHTMGPPMADASPRPRDGRPRVVTLVDLLSAHGGAERLAMGIATHLNPERFESILCVSRWPTPADYEQKDSSGPEALEALERAGARFLPLRRRHKVDVPAWTRLERFLTREHVDVLHTHKFGSNVWGAIVGSIARVPVMLAHEHTWSYEGQPWRRLLDRELIARSADRFIAVSREDQRRMSDIERIDPARTIFIPNGVPPFPPATGHDVRAELGIAPTAPLIGVVGLLRPQKAHEVLFDAVVQIARVRPDVRVLLVGNGPERERLGRLAEDLAISENVIFAGLRTDIPDVLASFDIAVCCSDFEGSPLSVLEYMDAGLPVVGTRVGGLPDMIVPDVTGLLVPRRDPPALANALLELLRDPERGRAMGRRGRARRRSEFDLDAVVGRVEALYTELLQRTGRTVPGA